MKTNMFRSGVVRRLCVATVFVVATTTLVRAQTYYWDQDSASPPVDLENGVFSSFPHGSDAPQPFPDYATSDIEFSASPVGTEAQTIYLDGIEDGGYVVGGLIFNQGSISLLDDPNSGRSGSSMDIAGDGITMNAGTGAATVSPQTIFIVGSQS